MAGREEVEVGSPRAGEIDILTIGVGSEWGLGVRG